MRKIDPRSLIRQYPGVHKTLGSVTSRHPKRFYKVFEDGIYVLVFKDGAAVVNRGIIEGHYANRCARAIEIYRV